MICVCGGAPSIFFQGAPNPLATTLNKTHTSPCPHAMSDCVRSPLASGRGCWLKILQHKQALALKSRTPALQSKVQPCSSICCHSPNIIKPINRATVFQSPIEMINPARTRHRRRETGKGRTKIQSGWTRLGRQEPKRREKCHRTSASCQKEETVKTPIALPACADV